MAKFRSPVLGFNHNIRHNGWLFHVQTEDSGAQNPHIYTHLFHEGVIVASKKLDYANEADVEIVKSLMQAQHKSVMKELKHGAFDDKIRLYLGSKEEKIALDSASAPVSIVEPAREPAAPPPSGPAEPIPVLVDEQAEATPKQPSVITHVGDVDEDAPTLPPPAPKPPAMPATAAPVDSSAASSTPYAQLLVSEEKQPAAVSGVLHAREPMLDDDDEINGLLSRLKEDSVEQPAGDTDRTGTWIVSRPGQKERPFDKTGPVAIPVPVQREEVARRVMSPPHLPEVPAPPPRTRKMTMPQINASSASPAAPRRPTPPPTQVNPQGRPSGQYSTVRPAPTRVSGSISTVRPGTGTNPPVQPKPPTIPPQARPVTPPPLTATGTGSVVNPPSTTRAPTPAQPPRSPISQVAPPIPRPPVSPTRSQAVPPVPPIPPRASVQISPPPRGQPSTTGPLRSQNVVPPTPPPTRPVVAARPTPAGRSAPMAVVPPAARRPPPSEGVVVARPAVVIGAPPTVIGAGGPGEASGGRRVHGREPTPPPNQPESIFGQDLISEKSLDEVIMAYLSEDSNED